MKPTVYLATDHAGYELKNEILSFVRDTLKLTVVDCGALTYDATDDYPDLIALAAAKVSATPTDRAIIFGGSGQGEAMVANKFPHVRATVYYGGAPEIVTLSREHNDANILSVGARFVSLAELQTVVETWLTTPFTAEPRHVRRIKKIELLERSS